MKHMSFSIFILLIIISLQLSACAPASAVEEETKPVHLEPIVGTDLNHVILTADAAKRLDIQMASVDAVNINGSKRIAVPYAAVLYDANGGAWVYVNTDTLVFVRQPIVIDYIKGDQAILSEGPESGSMVVTVGAAELFGSESEFEEE